MKRFIICAEGLSQAEEQQLITYFREKGMGWWHHIPNVWLVTSYKDEIGVAALRDLVKEMSGSKTTIVVEVQQSEFWAGSYLISQGNPFEWLKTNWDK